MYTPEPAKENLQKYSNVCFLFLLPLFFCWAVGKFKHITPIYAELLLQKDYKTIQSLATKPLVFCCLDIPESYIKDFFC